MAQLNRETLGRGFKFPFRIGGDSLSHDGPEQSRYEQHVIEGIQQIMLVQKRSRRYDRNFGSRLFELPFEELTRSPGLAVQFVRDAMDQEPRVDTLNVWTRVNEDKSELHVNLDVQFLDTSKTANLVFPFYRNDQGRPSLTEVRVTIN